MIVFYIGMFWKSLVLSKTHLLQSLGVLYLYGEWKSTHLSQCVLTSGEQAYTENMAVHVLSFRQLSGGGCKGWWTLTTVNSV